MFLFKKGDLANRMYIISHGKVAVISGEGKIFAHLEDGSFFGEIGLLYSTPRIASVKTETHCDLLELTKDEFEAIKNNYPEIINKVKEIAESRFEWFKKHLQSELQTDPADFTEEQIQNFRQVFCDVDLDGSGAIDTEELGKLLFRLNGKQFTPEELIKIMSRMDIDKNSTIEFNEFLAGLRHLRWLVDDPDQKKQKQPESSSSSSSSKAPAAATSISPAEAIVAAASAAAAAASAAAAAAAAAATAAAAAATAAAAVAALFAQSHPSQ